MNHCKVCYSPRVKEIDAAIIAGVTTLTEICEEFRFGSYSSLWRHSKAHVAMSVMVAPQFGEGGRPADLLTRYAQALEDADTVRALAVAAQNPELILRASREMRSAVEYLLDKLKIDSTEIVAQLAQADAHTTAMGRLVRKKPALGLALALVLEEGDERSLAADVRNYANVAQLALDRKAAQ